MITLAVQVNGKLRGALEIAPDLGQEEIETQALALENVQRALEGRNVKKIIIIPKRVVNIVG